MVSTAESYLEVHLSASGAGSRHALSMRRIGLEQACEPQPSIVWWSPDHECRGLRLGCQFETAPQDFGIAQMASVSTIGRITFSEALSFVPSPPGPVAMAHRIITQIILTGGRVFGKAFGEAYKQAQASSQYAKTAAKNGSTATYTSSGLTLDEACKILNVKPPMGGKTDMPAVMDRFKKLYDLNEPKKGGSFYLQSKVLRARERIEAEVRDAERKAAFEK